MIRKIYTGLDSLDFLRKRYKIVPGVQKNEPAGAGGAADTTQESAYDATLLFGSWTGGAAGAT